jgi:transketolase
LIEAMTDFPFPWTDLAARDSAPTEGLLQAAQALWGQALRFDPSDPLWPDRDRVVVSQPGLMDRLRDMTGDVDAGLDMSRAPPGQAIGTAVGLALAEARLSARFGRSLVDHRTWVLCDGADLETGVALEAAALAGMLGLARLCVIAGVAQSDTSGADRFAASGWSVRRVSCEVPGPDGQMDREAVRNAVVAAIAATVRARRPMLIICTQAAGIGSGRPTTDDAAVPAWAAVAARGRTARRGWQRRAFRHRLRAEFTRWQNGAAPPLWEVDWARAWRTNGGSGTPASPLAAAGHALGQIAQLRPELTCLTLAPPDHDPQHTALAIACGTRDHGMAALLNGLGLHGALLPFGVISAVSIDRLRPALRLAAVMRQQVVHLLCDEGAALQGADMIWLPVEQLASLRAMPNVFLFRPCDPVETRAAFTSALARTDGPSVIVLDGRPDTRRPDTEAAPHGGTLPLGIGPEQGAYVRSGPNVARDVTLIASGHEVAVAEALRRRLAGHGIEACVVSLPCWKQFARTDATYREAVLGTAPRIGLERASGFGWERWLGTEGLFLGAEAIANGCDDALLARVRAHLAAITTA